VVVTGPVGKRAIPTRVVIQWTMSENVLESTQLTDVAATDEQRAVGFVASEEHSDALVREILRARARGYEAFVVRIDGQTGESVRFAEQLGATVVDLRADEADPNAIRQRLTIAAEKAGCSNLLVNLEAGQRIDYERSEQRLDGERYCVDAVLVETEDGGEETETDPLLVGIPAYNEELAIGSTIHKTREYASEVLVVDDGSADRTADVAREAGATVVEHEDNQGKGAAVQTVLDYARDGEWAGLVLIDGDGQHLPEEIPDVARPVLDGDADMVIGSRYMDQGETDETPLYRRFGQQVLDVLTTGSSGKNISDSQSGFRALSPKAIEELSLTTDGIGVESEMINVATERDIEITEQPIDVRYEGIDGQTYNPLHHGLSVVTFILQMVRDRHPLLFFGVPGIALTVFGGFWGLDAILIYQSTGTFYPTKVLVSGFSTIIGVLGIFCGLILNQIAGMFDNIERSPN
jgi:hypothetical protein